MPMGFLNRAMAALSLLLLLAQRAPGWPAANLPESEAVVRESYSDVIKMTERQLPIANVSKVGADDLNRTAVDAERNRGDSSRTMIITAAQTITVTAVRAPHLNADTPLKPDNQQMASFDKAGKAIMNIAAAGGHGERVEIKSGTKFEVYRNHSCVFPHTTLGVPKVWPDLCPRHLDKKSLTSSPTIAIAPSIDGLIHAMLTPFIVCLSNVIHRPEQVVETLPDGSGLIRADGGPHYYWLASAPGLPSWVSNITCGVFVRDRDVKLV